jgi:hypothetical protein
MKISHPMIFVLRIGFAAKEERQTPHYSTAHHNTTQHNTTVENRKNERKKERRGN